MSRIEVTRRPLTAMAIARWDAITPAAAFACALLILFMRRPAILILAEPWADDGPLFTRALEDGARTLLEPFGGPLVLAERMLFVAETQVEPQWAPVLGNISALAITALVAAFLATRLPLDRSRRLVIAAGFVLLPASSEVFGTVGQLLWVMGAFLVAYAFVPRQKAWELVPLAVAGLTGPLVLFVLPLYIWRWRTDRGTVRTLAVVALCAVVQAIAIAFSARYLVAPDMALLPETLVTRVTHLPIAAGALLIALSAAVTTQLPRPIAVGLWFLIAAIPVAGILHGPQPTVDILSQAAGARYFWLATGLMAAMVVAARAGWTRTALLVVFAMLFAREVVLPPHPVAGWATESRCIGGDRACVVAVSPTYGWGEIWSVRWAPVSTISNPSEDGP